MPNANYTLPYYPETHDNPIKQNGQLQQYWRAIIAISRLIQSEELCEGITFTHHSAYGFDSATFEVRGNYSHKNQHREFHLYANRSEKGLKTYYTAENGNDMSRTGKDVTFSAGPAVLVFNAMKYIYRNRTK